MLWCFRVGLHCIISFSSDTTWFKPLIARSWWKLGQIQLALGGESGTELAKVHFEKARTLRKEIVPEFDQTKIEDLEDEDWDSSFLPLWRSLRIVYTLPFKRRARICIMCEVDLRKNQILATESPEHLGCS